MTELLKNKLQENAEEICNYIKNIDYDENITEFEINIYTKKTKIIFKFFNKNHFYFAYENTKAMLHYHDLKIDYNYTEELLLDLCNNWSIVKNKIEQCINEKESDIKNILNFKV